MLQQEVGHKDNYNKQYIFDNFFQRSTEKYTLSGYIKKYFGLNDSNLYFPDYYFKCKKCNHLTIIDWFNKEPICNSHSCRSIRHPQYLNGLRNSNEKWNKLDRNKDYFCNITNTLYNFGLKNNIKNFYEDISNKNYNIIEYMLEFHKDCLNFCLYCNKVIEYNNMLPIEQNRSKTKNFCCPQHYHEYIKKNNYKNINSKQSRKKQSKTLKNKIKNGIFTPKTNNKLTHRNLKCDIYPNNTYRSSWEIVFQNFYKNFEYEKIRIEYYDSDKKENRIYIIDFIDPETGNLYEIKPTSELKKNNILDKITAAENYAKINNVNFCIIDEYEIIKYYEIIKHELNEEIIICMEKLKKQVLKK